jgi:hypothetical protein
MFPARMRWGAHVLLLASFLMVIQTACSHAPQPAPLDPRNYPGDGVVVRFHTTDGVTYVTSSYAVTDSSIVIREILRDPKYYVPFDAKLFDQTLHAPPKDLALPTDLPMSRIQFMDRWEARSVSRDVTEGTLIVVGIVTAAVVALIIAINKAGGIGGD